MMISHDLQKRLLVIFFGLSGSGKSFIASAWSSRHNAPCFNTDVIRKKLARQQLLISGDNSYGQGMYSPAFTRKTYEALTAEAESAFAHSAAGIVVLDGTYICRIERKRVVERLNHLAQVVFVLCSCPERVARSRIERRQQSGKSVSDGTWQVYCKQKKIFEPPAELAPRQLLKLDTNASLEYLVHQLDEKLLSAGTR